jgi:hypothetical protein
MSVNLLDEPYAIKETLALHEMLRRLGIPAEDIHVYVDPKTDQVTVYAAHPTKRAVAFGVATHDCADFYARWKAAVAAWNTGLDDDDPMAIYNGSDVLRNNRVQVIMALATAGHLEHFRPPNEEDIT